MGISNHERSSPVIDQQKPQHHHEDIMNERYHHPFQPGQSKRQQQPQEQQQPQSSDEDDDKHVSFADCQIREFTQVLVSPESCLFSNNTLLEWLYSNCTSSYIILYRVIIRAAHKALPFRSAGTIPILRKWRSRGTKRLVLVVVRVPISSCPLKIDVKFLRQSPKPMWDERNVARVANCVLEARRWSRFLVFLRNE